VRNEAYKQVSMQHMVDVGSTLVGSSTLLKLLLVLLLVYCLPQLECIFSYFIMQSF